MTYGIRKKEALRLPRDGTQIRRLYDLFLSGNDVCVHSVVGNNGRRYLACLRDDYGCEIISFRNGRGGCKMLGRWDGEYFVPIERLCESVVA